MADWKENLPPELKDTLKEVLEKVSCFRYAYSQAEDVKVAQLWVAIAQLTKEIKELKELMGKVEEPFKAIVEIGEAEKRKTIEKIIEEILKPTDEATRKAAHKLVETLMKF